MPTFDFVLAGRYRLLAPLGEGGMASVYRARDLRLNREVAVKILREDLTRDPQFLARFEREAQIVASLSHPHIVPVYDVGEEQGSRFIVMEYIRGRTLHDLIESSGAVAPARIVDIMSSVLDALGYAHAHGLVHRDVKPHNILLGNDGTARLADFGIAHLVDSSATRTAVILGSAHYLSPEQARGEEATPASDIYAAGIVLYEMIWAHPPFDGPNALSIAHHHVHTPPSVLETPSAPECTPLVPIVERALAKNPLDRFPNAAAFASSLTQVEPDIARTAALPFPQERQRVPLPPRSHPVSSLKTESEEDALVLRRSARKTAVAGVVVIAILAVAGHFAALSVDGYTLPKYPSAPYALVPAAVLAALALTWFHVRSWRYQMDNNAAVLQWGLLSHHRFGVPVRYITTLELKQTPIDRLLGVGTLEVRARDQHGHERNLSLEDIPRPRQSYDELIRFLGRATALQEPVTRGQEPEDETNA